MYRAWAKKESLFIRNPDSVRPWNFVLDVLTGYLKAALSLEDDKMSGEAYNLGPDSFSEVEVEKLVSILWEHWKPKDFRPYEISKINPRLFEHKFLKLNSEKSH
ncbi:MAG: hypothetical protein R2753_13065 [Chitinophagales bacterium]